MSYIVDGLGSGSLGGDNATSDAFARLRVSNPVSLFDSQHEYDLTPLLWVERTTGTASSTHDPANAAVTLSVGSTTGDAITRQTRQYHRYQPGKSQMILLTFDFGAALSTGVAAAAGYYDDNNGVYLLRYLGGTSFGLRKNGVDTSVAQASWNIDAFDGSGPSGYTLDITKSQILFIDLEWLAVGRVRIGFVIDGRPYYAHEFTHANEGTAAYMRTANLPVRVQLLNLSGGAASSTKQICCSVISEGGFETNRGIPVSVNTGNTVSPAGPTRTPLLSIRPKTTFNGLTNRGSIVPAVATALAKGNDALIEVIYNGTLTGASFASANASSITDFDTAATSISGGIVVDSFYLATASAGGGGGASKAGGTGSVGLLTRLPLTLDVDGANPLPLTLCATGVSATSSVLAAFTWQELR